MAIPNGFTNGTIQLNSNDLAVFIPAHTTERRLFAAMMLQALVNPEFHFSCEDAIFECAIIHADKLIAELDKTEPTKG